MKSRSTNRRAKLAGFTLLEVILSLAILAGALAVLGELVRMGVRSAEEARDLTKAQLLCESLVAEIVSGAATIEAVSGAQIPNDPEWVFAIEIQPIESQTNEGLVTMQVTVSRDPALVRRPVSFSIVRWIKDPGASNTTTEESTAQANQNSSASTSGSGASSSSTTGGSRQ
jgi:prepilin-type N-terminal cleavage/methylation domain-containing protein